MAVVSTSTSYWLWAHDVALVVGELHLERDVINMTLSRIQGEANNAMLLNIK